MARVLLIDDESLIRATLVQILEADGHVVLEAVDGADGLRKTLETPPDIVITDILMPRKEGIETILALRNRFPDVKIIAMSGGGRLGSTEILEMARQAGADAVLKKPFRIGEFQRVFTEQLG